VHRENLSAITRTFSPAQDDTLNNAVAQNKKSQVPESPQKVAITELPGHNIRRLQQIAVSLFMEHTKEHGVTPVQYAALEEIFKSPNLDQRTLAKAIRFDTSTIGGVIDRLEKRGLVTRNASTTDRRVRLLELTSEGQQVLAAVQPDVLNAQEAIMAPLTATEQSQFVALTKKILAANESLAVVDE
jgi:MarR family transcriptional regulator, lower aerobic nicotinate degradation pathway regulator